MRVSEKGQTQGSPPPPPQAPLVIEAAGQLDAQTEFRYLGGSVREDDELMMQEINHRSLAACACSTFGNSPTDSTVETEGPTPESGGNGGPT